jgi:hypothetical protein
MFHRWAALALVLALCAFTPKHAAGQQKEPRGRKSGALGQNTPNPFGAETTIPFSVGEESCSDSSRVHVVSIRIYNILSQLVGVPKLVPAPPMADSTGTAEARPERPVRNLRLVCGSYEAHWDGKDRESGREVAPGIYVYELNVDGDRQVKKMVVAR